MDNQCTVGACGRPTQDVICAGHTAELVAALKSVPDLHADLEITLARRHKVSGSTEGRRGVTTPVMFHEAASETLRALERVVWHWAHTFHSANKHLSSPPKTVQAACEWMARFPALIASLDGAGDMWEDLARETRNARRVIDLPASLSYRGECGAPLDIGVCLQALYAPSDAVTVWCRTCGAEWDAAERRDLLAGQVADACMNATRASQVLAAVGIAIASATIRTYGRPRMVGGVQLPPKLVAVGRDQRGHPTYRVGDVLDIFLANQAPSINCAA
ncbi:hypothetical protein AB0383_48630 [Amycolatopsis sp. NPDC051373]|uniref:hypothetical protein n=1 Tax=Amycolatopsis sp. NPDC051373 TaxID=3155801 RepID=UPI00344F5031